MAFMRDPYYILMQDGQVLITDMNGNHVNTIPQDIFDEIVVMRWYNMTEMERMQAMGRVIETQFEMGADGVRRACGKPTVMERVDAQLKEEGIDREKIDKALSSTAKGHIQKGTQTHIGGAGRPIP